MSDEIMVGEPVLESSVLAFRAPELRDFVGYSGVATVQITPEHATLLMERLPDEDHEILPTGEVYVPQVHYRRKLNAVFGPAGWAMVPRGPYTMQDKTIAREYALVGPGGRFVSEAVGSCDYQPNNARMDYASACEGAKSNSLVRCCKDLGIGSECWDRRFCEKFKAEFCVKVWRTKARNKRGGEGDFQWRRKDATPWYDEKAAQVESTTRETGSNDPAPSKADEDTLAEFLTKTEAPPSSTPSCAQCGSINVEPDGKLWLKCLDCKTGTKRGTI